MGGRVSGFKNGGDTGDGEDGGRDGSGYKNDGEMGDGDEDSEDHGSNGDSGNGEDGKEDGGVGDMRGFNFSTCLHLPFG